MFKKAIFLNFILTSTLVSVIFSFNYFVDPFDLLMGRLPKKYPLNFLKPEKSSHAYLWSIYQVQSSKWQFMWKKFQNFYIISLKKQ